MLPSAAATECPLARSLSSWVIGAVDPVVVTGLATVVLANGAPEADAVFVRGGLWAAAACERPGWPDALAGSNCATGRLGPVAALVVWFEAEVLDTAVRAFAAGAAEAEVGAAAVPDEPGRVAGVTATGKFFLSVSGGVLPG